MIKKILFSLVIINTVATVIPVHADRVGFGFGVGGGRRHGGFGLSIGGGSPYHGGWGGGYRRWDRPWVDDYYEPRTTYVYREPRVKYITTTSSDDGTVDRKSKSYWRVTNKTGEEIVVSSDREDRTLEAGAANRKVFREDSFSITIKTKSGLSGSFRNVKDHNIDVIKTKDNEIEVETWTE